MIAELSDGDRKKITSPSLLLKRSVFFRNRVLFGCNWRADIISCIRLGFDNPSEIKNGCIAPTKQLTAFLTISFFFNNRAPAPLRGLFRHSPICRHRQYTDVLGPQAGNEQFRKNDVGRHTPFQMKILSIVSIITATVCYFGYPCLNPTSSSDSVQRAPAAVKGCAGIFVDRQERARGFDPLNENATQSA